MLFSTPAFSAPPLRSKSLNAKLLQDHGLDPGLYVNDSTVMKLNTLLSVLETQVTWLSPVQGSFCQHTNTTVATRVCMWVVVSELARISS